MYLFCPKTMTLLSWSGRSEWLPVSHFLFLEMCLRGSLFQIYRMLVFWYTRKLFKTQYCWKCFPARLSTHFMLDEQLHHTPSQPYFKLPPFSNYITKYHAGLFKCTNNVTLAQWKRWEHCTFACQYHSQIEVELVFGYAALLWDFITFAQQCVVL